MLIENETLYHAIAYLIKNTSSCQLTKLIKLLYFFDMEHVRRVGIPATGLTYKAWKKGPVPERLRTNVVQENNEEFNDSFSVNCVVNGNFESYQITPKFELDMLSFSKVQLDILKELSSKFKDSTAQSLINETHKDTDPWHLVYEVNGQKNAEIPFELAANPSDAQALEVIKCRLSLHDI